VGPRQGCLLPFLRIHAEDAERESIIVRRSVGFFIDNDRGLFRDFVVELEVGDFAPQTKQVISTSKSAEHLGPHDLLLPVRLSEL
jgi:hypothetical protein